MHLLPNLLLGLLAFHLTTVPALQVLPVPTPSKTHSIDEAAELGPTELDTADRGALEPGHSAHAYSEATRSVYDTPLLNCNPSTQYLLPGVYRYESPNYKQNNPGNYNNDDNCHYSFKPADAKGKLRFDCFFFQLEDSVNCVKDYFQIQGSDRSCKYCGKASPPSFLTDSLNINFVTDSSVTDKGFFCTVMSKESGAGCGGLQCGTRYVTPGKYTLLSKNYPGDYGTNLYCKWELIAVDPSNTMDFSCSSFDIISWDNSCEWDWMKVNGTRYCNTSKPPTIKYKGAINVEYSTPDLPHKVRKGFNCTVTVSDGGS